MKAFSKHIYTKLFRLLLCLSLFAAGAPTVARAADTNNPPAETVAIEPKTPTYDETIAWLKKIYASEQCHATVRWEKEEGKCHLHLTQTFQELTSGRVAVCCENNGTDTSGGVVTSKSKTTFDIQAIEKAYVEKDGTFTYYMVVVKTVGDKKKIAWERSDQAGSDYKLTEHASVSSETSVFFTTDEETANKVAKAFNHAIKLAPKDLF